MAIWRATVLGPLVSARLEHGDVRGLCEQAAARLHEHPDGRLIRVSWRTIESWLYAYKARGPNISDWHTRFHKYPQRYFHMRPEPTIWHPGMRHAVGSENMRAPGRSGQYQRQMTGYRAFIPVPLPPDPPVVRDAEMDDLHFKATLALGRLDGATETLPNPDLFVFMYVRKEAVLSSQIEGTQASLIDVVEFEAGRLRPDRPQDVTEVVNYVRAMNHGLARLQDLPVSLRLIKEIHGELLRGVRGQERNPGEFRTSQNWIGPPGCNLQTASFVPPPPHELVGALGGLEKFIHSPDPMPALLKVGMVHAQFETIHPFLDGNGRVGRLLITLLLCEQGVLSRPLLYLSYFFKQHRADYYRHLQETRDQGDWESWLKFFLRGVALVAGEATTKARRIANMREQHRSRISGDMGRAAGNALALHERLFERPIVAVNDVAEFTGVTFATANRLVDGLCALGILKETTGQRRNRVFAYDPYLAQFSDDETTTPEVVDEASG